MTTSEKAKQIQGLKGVIEAHERNGHKSIVRAMTTRLRELEAIETKPGEEMIFIGVGWLKTGRIV